MNKPINIFILISVILNIFLIGTVIGYASHQWGRHHWPRPEMAERHSLSPEKQDLLDSTMRQAFKEGKTYRREISQLQQEIIGILKAEPFDEAAYDSRIEKIHVLRGKQVRQFTDAIKHLAQTFTPEEREVLADIVRRPPLRKHRYPPMDKKPSPQSKRPSDLRP